MPISHRFGQKGEKYGTMYSVKIPVPISGTWITVQTDVIPGNHPFLIGYPALKRMRASIDVDHFMLTVKSVEKNIQAKLLSNEVYPVLSISDNVK